MTSLIRWQNVDTDIDNIVRSFFAPVAAREAVRAVALKMDVSENDKNYVVHADIPGMSKDNIKVEIDGNQVAVSAETKSEKEEKNGERVLRAERYSGKFYRAFALSEDIDEENAQAKYENGVLTLTLPKKATAKSRLLTVN
jgi:HSP20 family protein